MKNMFTTFRSRAIISLLLVLPFIMLELVNRRSFHEGFPIALFAWLWLLPVIFMITLMPILRTIRAGNGIPAQPATLWIRALISVLIAGLWIGLLVDQWPCFLGVPNCD
jgi:hypothetical protein